MAFYPLLVFKWTYVNFMLNWFSPLPTWLRNIKTASERQSWASTVGVLWLHNEFFSVCFFFSKFSSKYRDFIIRSSRSNIREFIALGYLVYFRMKLLMFHNASWTKCSQKYRDIIYTAAGAALLHYRVTWLNVRLRVPSSQEASKHQIFRKHTIYHINQC